MVKTTTTLVALALILGGLLLSAGSAQETKTTEEEKEYTETAKEDGIIYQTYQTKHVPSGKTRPIVFLYGANSGCTPWNPDEMEIRTVKPPEHGTISFIDGRESSNFYRPHLKHCNKRQMPGKWVRYTSEKSYVGPDEFVLFEMYPEGKPYQATYRVKVH
jgi:hypothetical protein